MKLKHDKFQKARDGKSKLLELFCSSCNYALCSYQKDGSGQLKRLYLDRISEANFSLPSPSIKCPQCNELIGMLTIYKKEHRPAFQLVPGKIRK